MYDQPNSLFYQQQVKESVIQNLNSQDESKLRNNIVIEIPKEASKPIIDQIQAFFTIEYYQEYFDVTSEIVIRRILNSFNPFSGNFFDIAAGKPDFYGPFWIITTLVFTMAASANISAYLQLPPGSQFIYQLQFLPLAALILYSKGLIFPGIMKSILSCLGSKYITFSQVLCLYGYSSSITIPILLLECIQNPAIQWILLMYAIFGTTMFLITNLNKQKKKKFTHIISELKYIEKQNNRYIIIAIIGAMQVALMIFYKAYFFNNQKFINPITNTEEHGVKHLPY